jgi:vacuolar-type H+-ATPase subunit H
MMGMERVLSSGEGLQNLLDDADAGAKAKIAKAQSTADEKITVAQGEAARKKAMAQRGTGIEELLKEEEKKAERAAKKILKDYEAKAEALKDVPDDKIKAAIETVIKEVLPK